ncbi:MAG: trans-sulfuration enzyme family protein [Aggregatilineales bacterium]
MSDTHDPRLDLLHEDRGDYRGAFNPPIYRASTFNQSSLERFTSPDASTPPNYIYGRVANPTTRVFEELIAKIEHADDAMAFSSGMGAITAAILAFVGHGDHVLLVSHAYGPARTFLEQMAPRMALTVETFEPGADIEPLMRPNTKLVYVESPTSLYFEMLDLREIGRIARAHGAITITDNTWATPIYQQPLDLGIDISLHSGTKYINGHSDALCGVAATSSELMKTLRPMAITLGATLSPEDAYLCVRGLRTLAIRMPHHMESGLAVARWLHDHPLVERVLHPALPDSPGYELWRSQMSGASGLFSIVLRAGPEGAAAAFANSLKLFGLAPSWGGFESLLAPVEIKPDQPATFRLAIGLEPVDALIADLEQALARYGEFISQPAHA